MSDEMIDLYRKLDTNEKRNELSSLLFKLDKLIDQLILKNDIKNINLASVKNYDCKNQFFETEDDVLLFFYDDVWKVKNKILALLTKK